MTYKLTFAFMLGIRYYLNVNSMADIKWRNRKWAISSEATRNQRVNYGQKHTLYGDHFRRHLNCSASCLRAFTSSQS